MSAAAWSRLVGCKPAMASELSRFIEDELRNKGYAYDDDDPEADNPHASLMGALRVEVRGQQCAPGSVLPGGLTVAWACCAGACEGAADPAEAGQPQAGGGHRRGHPAGGGGLGFADGIAAHRRPTRCATTQLHLPTAASSTSTWWRHLPATAQLTAVAGAACSASIWLHPCGANNSCLSRGLTQWSC